MDPDLVPASVDSLNEALIFFNILPDQKKCRADFVLRQHIQHFWCVARMRTVVEGERDLAAGWVTAPQDVGVAGLHPCVGAEEVRGEHENLFEFRSADFSLLFWRNEACYVGGLKSAFRISSINCFKN